MEKYIFDESNGLWYELQGDYYIPCLTLPDGENYFGDKGTKSGLRKIIQSDTAILSQAANSTLIFITLIYWQVKQKAGLLTSLLNSKA